jgi:hypothetical protein
VNGRDFADSPMAFASTAAAWTAITGGRLTLSLILGRGSGIRSLRRAGNSYGQKTKPRQIKMRTIHGYIFLNGTEHLKDASPAAKVTQTYRVGRGNGLCLSLIDSGKAGGKFPVSAVCAPQAES